MDHHVQVHKVTQKGGDGHDNHQAGEHHSQGGHGATQPPHPVITHKGGGVHGDDAGGTLAYSVVVRQFLLGGPAFVVHQLPLQDGEHGVAAAEGAHPDFGKGKEEAHVLFHARSSHSSSHRRATASLGIRQSPRGERVTEPTLGPSGRQERLNCWAKKRR